MKPTRLLSVILLTLPLSAADAQVAEPAMVVAVSAIGASSESIRIDATVGQPFAMRLQGSGYVVDLGFWTPRSMLPTAAEEAAPEIPLRLSLDQNYPNPFNPATVIRYALPDDGHVTLTVYGSGGRRIADLVNATQPAGYHDVRFDAAGLPSGVYLYRLEGPGASETRAMLLTR